MLSVVKLYSTPNESFNLVWLSATHVNSFLNLFRLDKFFYYQNRFPLFHF
ncbi:hypothetical protein CUZ91_2336 [Enterococcus xinjiangensis]|nr:hypothetical protein [Enterococcus lactis]